MTAAQRVVAVGAAAEIALALLQETAKWQLDDERLSGGLYEAARRLIARRCCDPAFGPEQVANGVGCSRATLYRAFAAHDESVAAVIWSSRLERAHRMLLSAEGQGMTLSDIAFACGFREATTFAHMFRRHHGTSPGEARLQAAEQPRRFVQGPFRCLPGGRD